MSETAERRTTARVILVDDQHRTLLFRVLDPLDTKDPCWLTPGGGVQAGETIRDAAVRELFEETGLVVDRDELGNPVATCRGPWVFRGKALVQEDWYFALHTAAFEPDPSGWEPLEVDLHRGWRWWSPAELATTSELVFPGTLHVLLESLASGRHRGDPVELPWPLAVDSPSDDPA